MFVGRLVPRAWLVSVAPCFRRSSLGGMRKVGLRGCLSELRPPFAELRPPFAEAWPRWARPGVPPLYPGRHVSHIGMHPRGTGAGHISKFRLSSGQLPDGSSYQPSLQTLGRSERRAPPLLGESIFRHGAGAVGGSTDPPRGPALPPLPRTRGPTPSVSTVVLLQGRASLARLPIPLPGCMSSHTNARRLVGGGHGRLARPRLPPLAKYRRGILAGRACDVGCAPAHLAELHMGARRLLNSLAAQCLLVESRANFQCEHVGVCERVRMAQGPA